MLKTGGSEILEYWDNNINGIYIHKKINSTEFS
jgi:hypothetical protein